MNFGVKKSRNDGTIINAPIRQVPIDITTRYPKNRIEVNPENIRAENPAITLIALIIILLPIVVTAADVASLKSIPCLIALLKLHMY